MARRCDEAGVDQPDEQDEQPDAGGDREFQLHGHGVEHHAAQITGMGFPGGHYLLGIFITQFIERELAALGNRHGLLEPNLWVETRQTQARTQMTFGIRLQRQTTFGQRLVQADGGERVLQGFA